MDKWLLADECNWTCPYTGKRITPRTIDNFDVEHIFPRQFLDDSFANKTLCEHDFNRNRKKNRLPVEVLSGDEWGEVIARVKQFKGPGAKGKLKRFQSEEVPDDFVSRQLNDTRYNARLAADFLSVLYGGRSDQAGNQRIVTPTGNLTWILRTGWGLNSILSETAKKDRFDNRHHAIDAVCVALATQKTIQLAADLAKKRFLAGERFNKFLEELAQKTPWLNFRETVRSSIAKIIISHRPTRRIAGPLHAETNYSKPFLTPQIQMPDGGAGNGKRGTKHLPAVVRFRVRKSLDKLTEKDILGDAIADPHVRAAVQQKYEELCLTATKKIDKSPAKMWSDLSKIDKFPILPPSKKRLRNGESTKGSPIYKVRVVVEAKPRAIGNGIRQRQVASGKDSNFATMIYAVLDEAGQEIRWEQEVITRLDAHLRLSANGGGRGRKKANHTSDMKGLLAEKVLIPRSGDEMREMTIPPFKLKPSEQLRFLFALVKNDMVEMDGPGGHRAIYRLQNLSANELQFCDHTRSTVLKDERTIWNRITSLNSLRARNIITVSVDPLGRVRSK